MRRRTQAGTSTHHHQLPKKKLQNVRTTTRAVAALGHTSARALFCASVHNSTAAPRRSTAVSHRAPCVALKGRQRRERRRTLRSGDRGAALKSVPHQNPAASRCCVATAAQHKAGVVGSLRGSRRGWHLLPGPAHAAPASRGEGLLLKGARGHDCLSLRARAFEGTLRSGGGGVRSCRFFSGLVRGWACARVRWLG